MWNQDLYNKVIDFAGKAHGSQTVIDGGTSYVVHIAKVASEAEKLIATGNFFGNPDLLIAVALLHDVLEDTDVTYDQLKYMFGETTADCVKALTRNKFLDEKGSIVKMASLIDSIERIKKQPIETAMVKMCDRIVNLHNIPHSWTEAKVNQYKLESEVILKELGFANEYLKERLKEKIDNYLYIND